MKKITSFFSLLFILALFFVSVSAASGINAAERSVLNNYKAGYTYDGNLIVPTAGDFTMAENLMNHDDVNLSDADAAVVNEAIDDIYAILSRTGPNPTQTDRDAILNIASGTASDLGFTLTYDPSSDIASILSNDGVIASFDLNAGTVVKQTGFSASAYAGLGLLFALVSVSYVALKKRND